MFTIVNAKLIGDDVIFSDGNSRPATEEEKKWFKNRHLKAVLKDGEYSLVRYCDYHRHSGYSLLDGCISIKEMVMHTEFAGAVTDHGNMYAALAFYKAMKKAGKIPILGEEFYCESIDGEKSKNHLILLAKNNVGYKNLLMLSSLAFKNFYKKPQISYGMLEKYHEGLVCTSACLGGELPKAITNRDLQKADAIIMKFKEMFGEDYYIEIQHHQIKEEKFVNPILMKLARKNNVKLVAATDSHYVDKDDEEVHDVILCIGTKKTFQDADRFRFEGTGYHLHTADEVDELFKDCPEAIDNTLEIMEKCTGVEIDLGHNYLPHFVIPEEYKDEISYLKHLAKEGFNERFQDMFSGKPEDDEETIKTKNEKKQEYWDRWLYEMSVIEQMGFAGYFLIVWDFLNYCRKNDIPIGPGRGSGAGSLILYCLHITNFDPIKYGLLFERFLNPDRISLPDVDSDISEEKRQQVIDYVTQKYGEDHVSHIITFGTLAAKSAIRDVARVLGLPASESRLLTKAVPARPKITIQDALDESPELVELINGNDMYKRIIKIAQKIEGLPRQTGIHACGICISKEPITSYCPQAMIHDEITGEITISSQWTGPECEEVGLVKFDFLGLRTLDVIDNSVHLINERNKKKGIETHYTMDTIPINDIASYRYLLKGNTAGVFQFESDGMTGLLKKMFIDVKDDDSPEKGDEYFERLIAAVSLYRPGPMDEIPNYIEAMHSGNVHYDHPKLESILNSTYGILVYQEEIMFAVRKLAGFTAGQSDTIRKAMGKKKIDIMNEYGEYFIYGSAKYDKEHPDSQKNIKGCINNGVKKEDALIIWDKMVKFAEYAFNKSHATCYAGLGAKTAWLACHYPVEFMTGILNSYIGTNDKIAKYSSVCAGYDIKIYNPDINKSGKNFTVIDDDTTKTGCSIIFGLGGVKDVGTVAAEAIIEERKNGLFVNLEDFLSRMADYKFNKRALTALSYSGAFDNFGYTRSTLIQSTEKMLSLIKKIKNDNKDQLTLFDTLGLDKYDLGLKNIPEFNETDKALAEQEFLGYFLHHPISQYSKKIERWRKKNMLTNIDAVCEKLDETTQKVRIAGLVSEKEAVYYTDKRTGAPKQILKFTLNDGTGTIKCVMFNEEAKRYSAFFNDSSIIYVLGKGSANDFGPQVSVDNVYVFDESDKD